MICFPKIASRFSCRCLLLLAVTGMAWVLTGEHAEARRRLFHCRCAPARQCCEPASYSSSSYANAETYCPVYGAYPAGDLWLYYGMKHVAGPPPSCKGPPRPLYYESQLTYTLGCGVYNAKYCIEQSGFERARHGCSKGFNKNMDVPPYVLENKLADTKRSFKDQGGTWHKLHLFKVKVTLGGVSYPDIGHGYGPRQGDTAEYPPVQGVEFKKELDGYCGYVVFEGVRYDVLLNKN